MSSLADNLYNHSPVWLQNLLISTYGYKLYHKRYSGIVFKKAQDDIYRVNSMTASELQAFQAERLHETIKHCRANVPYYIKQFAELGLTEKDFTQTDHLKKLPILEKQTVRENPKEFRAKNTQPYVVQNTSGSTGTPLSLWVDEYTYKLAMALLIDYEQKNGVNFGARRATFAGRMIQPVEKMTPPFSRFNRAENQRLFSAYHINKNTFPHYDKELERFQPEEIIGYPSAIYSIATQYLDHKKSPRFKPKAIITNSETLLAWQREVIESVFDCKIRDYYGTAEYVTFAGQCENNSYHFNSIIGISEVVSDYEGIDIEPESGDIITTSLTNGIMPLLRYRIGDTAKSAQSHCSCGNVSINTKQILGRIDDVILTSDGRRIGRLDHIFKGMTEIKEAQIIQKFAGSCLINLVINSGKRLDEVALVSNLEHRLGKNFQVEFSYLQRIPRGPNGKFKAVISQVESQ